MKNKIAAIIAGLTLGLLGTLAWAATEKVDRVGSAYPVFFNKGMYVGPDVPNPTNDTVHKVGRMLAGSATIDFASVTILCAASTAISVPGAQVNDPCFVGPPASGGAANSSFTCYVSAADLVVVKHCPAGTASDPASAIYEVRVISNNL